MSVSRALGSRQRVSIDSINSLVKSAEYAVRGPIVARSAELAAQLKDSEKAKLLPFKKIIACNIGNPHALQQQPMSFVRDVVSLVINPSLKFQVTFPADVVSRAEKYLASMPGVGAYSESQGIAAVRDEVSGFLQRRDGYESNPNDIFLTNGASEGVRFCMQTMLREQSSGFKDGILAPVPQYPIYSALATLLEGSLQPYYLDESNAWGCSTAALQEGLKKATDSGVSIRALVVINPGNPTGQVLEQENMRDIISFCKEEKICLMADEVYQENIWKTGAKFVSFRKVALDMGMKQDDADGLQMVSFHSISKGFYGECGLRGGYFELFGIPSEVKAQLLKMASLSLCSNTIGQLATGLMVQPPVSGEPSYEKYAAEKSAILSSLQRRAELLSASLNALEGVSCNAIDGALYAFPTITLPASAVAAAKQQGVAADAMYCSQLLERTGIVLVPGSGFGQREGTFHFRSTILPPEDAFHDVVGLIAHFHAEFMQQYR